MIGILLNNRYQVTAAIGKGAMGEVFRAADKQTGADVAVKLMAGQLAFDAEMIERFRREGDALQQLRHPNIVGIVDTFQHESRQAIVLEYVPGGSLHDLLKREAPLDIPRVKQVALDLCDALIRAHRLNIVHRDIKPENVLMAEDGTPRLTDFGVARLVGGATRLTGTGTQIGTPYYMSPEAWEGEQADAQSDIWSLGIMLYEMLSGQVPFGGETMAAVMNKVLTAPLPDLRSVRPEVPDGLAQVIERMLTRDRSVRYQSMREVAADLERGRSTEGGEVSRKGRPTAKPKAAKAPEVEREGAAPGRTRLPGWALAIGAVIAVPLLGVIVMAVFNLCPPPGPWPLPPWCPGSQFTWPFSAPAAITTTPTLITEGALGSVLFEDNFDEGPSPRWDFQPRTWQAASVDGRTVLQNFPTEQEGFASLQGESWTDYAVQFDFKFLQPDEHNAHYFYVNFRTTDCPPSVHALDTYNVVLSTDASALQKSSCETRMMEQLANNDRNFTAEGWHTAQIIAIGNRVQVLVDGQQYFDFTDDDSPHLSGGFSIDMSNEVELAIDNFRVNEIIPGESAPAATATPTVAAPSYVTDGAPGSVLFEDDFESGLSSPLWMEVDPEWQAEVVDGRAVLHGRGPKDGNFAFVQPPDEWTDYALQTDFYFLEPPADGNYHLQLVTRRGSCPPETGWMNSYTLDVLNSGLQLVKGTCDRPRDWLTLTSVERIIKSHQWHTIQMEVIGNRIVVNLDGEKWMDYLDESNPLLQGSVALVTNDSTEALFDNVRVTEIVPTEYTLGDAIFEDDFESGGLSQWTPDGDWEVIEDESGNSVLHPITTRGNFQHILANGSSGEDYSAQLRFKILDAPPGSGYNSQDPEFSINVRTDWGSAGCNRYQIVFESDEARIHRNQSAACPDTMLERVSISPEWNVWHTARVVVYGAMVTVYLDESKIVEATDDPSTWAGGLGLEAGTGMEVYFDDVRVTEIAPPAASGALYLDGKSGYASVPFDDSLRLTQAFTVEAWINLESRAAKTCTDGAGYCNFMPIIVQSNQSSSIGNYTLAVNLGKPLFGFEPASIGDVVLYGDATIGSGWHHLAAVHTFGKSAQTQIYLDGRPVAGTWVGGDRANQAAYTLAQSNYLIGYMTVGPEAYFAGLLDELRVWNVARTQEEIQATMNGELTGSEPGLAAYWKFNDSPGATTARDSSPNGNDAALKGGAEIQISDAQVTP